jgi:hypothetical protein
MRLVLLGGIVAIMIAAVVAVQVTLALRHRAPAAVALPLHAVGEVGLPGDGSRFEYAALDSDAGVLFIAHLGGSQIIEVNIRANQVLRVIDGVDQVHGVPVVPSRHQVYATATGANRMVMLDEETGQRLGEAPTGDYPDGLSPPTRTFVAVDSTTHRSYFPVPQGRDGRPALLMLDPTHDRSPWLPSDDLPPRAGHRLWATLPRIPRR